MRHRGQSCIKLLRFRQPAWVLTVFSPYNPEGWTGQQKGMGRLHARPRWHALIRV